MNYGYINQWGEIYLGYQEKKEFRGGARKGAGRKVIGVTRPIKLTLPDETWNWIEEAIQKGKATGMSEFIRKKLHELKKSEEEQQEKFEGRGMG